MFFGDQFINFLYLKDVVGVFVYMLEYNVKDEIFNVVFLVYLKKKEFYLYMVVDIGVDFFIFVDSGIIFKREMLVDKLLNKMDF